MDIFTLQTEENGQNVPYPGPLSDKTQKEDVFRFIKEKCQMCWLQLDDPVQYKSYFFWMIIEHFFKRNGRVLMAELATVLFRVYSCVKRKLGRVKNQEDWCLPLAKLLCSRVTGDEHKKAVVTMGDVYVARGWIYAAHICYVVAQTALGTRSQFQLIGLKWYVSFPLISKELMERTEVYEYMLSLTSGIGQPRFQEMKYLYAWDLAMSGCHAQALLYCENIARNIFRFPRLISSFFMERVIMLCKKLLGCKEIKEVDWLLKLCQLHKAFSVNNPEFTANDLSSCGHESQDFQEDLGSVYTVGKLLGKGFFGSVYAGERKADGKTPGLKPMEVELMERVSKPPRCESVVELLDWFDMSTAYILVLERPNPCMNLKKFRQSQKNGHLSEYKAREIMRQVTQAVHHCFERKVFHGDIRSENILVNTDTLEVKLIDFGCGKLLENPANSTEMYTSIWNLGVLLTEMVSGSTLFQCLDQIIENSSEFVSGGPRPGSGNVFITRKFKNILNKNSV